MLHFALWTIVVGNMVSGSINICSIIGSKEMANRVIHAIALPFSLLWVWTAWTVLGLV
jgi:hypothetical protein